MLDGQQQKFAEGERAAPDWEKVIMAEILVYHLQNECQPKTFYAHD